MAIVTLKKLTICGLNHEKTEIIEKLQELGGAHLIPLNELVFSTEIATQRHTEKTVRALKFLSQCSTKRHQVNCKEKFNLDNIVKQALFIQNEIRSLSDQRDFLVNRIKEIRPWGDFDLASAGNLGGIKCWFYIIPKRLMKLLKDDLTFQVVHKDNIHCYVVILAEREPSSADVPVPRTHTGKIPLSALTKQLQDTELAIEDKQAERESLTRWITRITLSLVNNEDEVDLQVANSLCLEDENIFAVQAWVPENEIKKFIIFAEIHSLALLVEDISNEDRPPTLLKNTERLAGGEEIVKFYQTPAYNAWDPSSVVFFSFALFFAMILSDAGYAAVFGLLLALKWKKLGKNLQGHRLRYLAIVTLFFSIIWGVLTGGYFGYSPPQQSFAGFLKILDLNDFDSMMRLSITVGALHIILANLIKAYQFQHKIIAYASLGWISVVIGGYILWIADSAIDHVKTLNDVAYSLLILGVGLLLFCSNERKIKKPVDFLWQILDGIKNITGLTKIFGDILSYMRLFALGLASASLALTFNQLAVQVYTTVPGLGLLFSILILILGHTLNLMLCLMSGVVHGLRLNFIEFYNWSISDEGYPFKAFSKKGGN